jgi:hypothetical protein
VGIGVCAHGRPLLVNARTPSAVPGGMGVVVTQMAGPLTTTIAFVTAMLAGRVSVR